jgi:hypothetical protein
MPQAFIYQILNHYTSPQALDPGFRVLDNSSNERPDWYEYWPIRKFLTSEALDENAFYGFLSPKFKAKTNLDAAHVAELVRTSDPATDMILLTPSIQNNAYFLNVFAHGDAKHPGLLGVAQRLFARLGRPTNLVDLVTDSRIEVFSNYFIAKPRFWREWLSITEAMFAIAEDPADALGVELCAATSYRARATAPMKIFVMERIATWILAVDRRFVARVCDPFAAGSKIHRAPVAIVCDALKIAYATQGRAQYKDLFLLVQGLRRLLTWQVRAGSVFGFKHVRPCLRQLAAYWIKNGR